MWEMQNAALPATSAQGCTLSRTTLRVIGQNHCTLCKRSAAEHPEYDVALYSTWRPPLPPATLAPNPADESLLGDDDGESTAIAIGEPVSSTQQPTSFNGFEFIATVSGWIITVGLWFHVLFLIPFCESERRSGSAPSPCREYYGSGTGGLGWRYHAQVWIVLGILVVLYLLLAVVSPTRRYLSNILSRGIEDYVSRLIKAEPRLAWSIQCYHFRSESYTDSKGKRRTRRKRVNTHTAHSAFEFDVCDDVSGAVIGPTFAPVRRLRCQKNHIFADQHTAAAHAQEFSSWVRENDRDTHKDVRETLELPNFEAMTLAYPVESPPFGISLLAYWLCTLLLMGMPYSLFFFARTTPVDFYCVKRISRRVQVGL
jgi:hypothetical protein